MESYKHKYAKEILKQWIDLDFIRIDLEQMFFMNGLLIFICDLVCYDENGINTIYEVEHKHELDATKLNKMQQYFYYNDIIVNLYEIQAEWIMRQIEKPKKLKYIDFTTK